MRKIRIIQGEISLAHEREVSWMKVEHHTSRGWYDQSQGVIQGREKKQVLRI